MEENKRSSRPFQDYYQQRLNGGFKLKDDVYRKTVNEIRCFDTYKKAVNKVKNKSMAKQNDVLVKSVAEIYLDAIFEAKQWVTLDYREAVFEHFTKDVPYDLLSEKYHLTESSMKRWGQIYVYAVAHILGEDFE